MDANTQFEKLRKMKKDAAVKEIMSTELETVHEEDSLNKIRQVFSTGEFHHLPVLSEGGKLAGIISNEDLNRFIQMLAFDAKNVRHGPRLARDIMTQYPISLEMEDSIGLAADIFMANQFHALPVVDDGDLIGIVTTHDILRYCFESPL